MIVRYMMQNETPLALRSGRENNREGTLHYLPGSTILGGLAAVHGSLRATQRNQFARFFMSGRVAFGNLYPATFEKKYAALRDVDDEPIRPIPNTAFTCKVHSGFAYGSDVQEPQHGVRDHLIAWATYALSQQQNAAALAAVRNCPHCHHAMDRVRGFYRQYEEAFGNSKPKTELRTRTGINRWTGSTAQGILYSREAIQAGYKFWGTLQFSDETIRDEFEEFLTDVSEKGLLRFGNNRSRGMGRLRLEPFSMEVYVPDSAEIIAERAQKFDAKLRKALGTYAAAVFYLPITLQSDVILIDKLFRSQLQLTPKHCGLSNGELVYHHAGRKRMMGWSSLWGLPKADTWAITKGSVFLFALESEPDFNTLAQLQASGIGVRQAEGFGQLTIAHPFHLETELR